MIDRLTTWDGRIEPALCWWRPAMVRRL